MLYIHTMYAWVHLFSDFFGFLSGSTDEKVKQTISSLGNGNIFATALSPKNTIKILFFTGSCANILAGQKGKLSSLIQRTP